MSLPARLRMAVLARDGYTCIYCGRRPPEVTLEPDHVLPRALGGLDLTTNLVTSCKGCNQGKSDQSLSLPVGYTLEPVGFQRRAIGRIRNVGGALGHFGWCSDACPTCGQTTLPAFLIDGDALSVQLGYRCTNGHSWHVWWTPEPARIHSSAVRRATAMSA